MRIAIIGAGPAGLSCALECEKLGVVPDVFERDREVGWVWPRVIVLLSVFERRLGDITRHLRRTYGLDVKPLARCRRIVMHAPNATATVEGDLGYFWERGKGPFSVENQLRAGLQHTPIQYNRPADYRELAGTYDWVVVADGKATAARDLGVWEDCGRVVMTGGAALGSFDTTSTSVYINTEYAGSGYARVTPLNATQAVVALYCIGRPEQTAERLWEMFIEREDLGRLEFLYRITPPPFATGRPKTARAGNVLLAGRAAGMVERFLGTGIPYAMASGIMAARAIVTGLDYDEALRPMWKHLENLSAFRQPFETLHNDGYDKLVGALGNPVVQGALYNTGLNFADLIGGVIKGVYH